MLLHTMEVLDRRHNGFGQFKYRVEIGGLNHVDRIQNFNEIREWCWTVWGRSCELDYARARFFKDQPHAIVWCWRKNSQEPHGYIYLLGPEQASFFKLKWM
jgi:hypothetical protein